MKSLNQQIYEYYLSGGRLTTLDCLRKFHTSELRSINCKIQKAFNIKLSNEWIKNADKQYKEYFLQKQLQMFN